MLKCIDCATKVIKRCCLLVNVLNCRAPVAATVKPDSAARSDAKIICNDVFMVSYQPVLIHSIAFGSVPTANFCPTLVPYLYICILLTALFSTQVFPGQQHRLRSCRTTITKTNLGSYLTSLYPFEAIYSLSLNSLTIAFASHPLKQSPLD